MNSPVSMIIGVGPGNGAALARRFDQSGHRVALLSRSRTHMDELASELNQAITIACDVTESEQIVDAVTDVESVAGPVDNLIYNVGEGQFANVEETTERSFEHAWRVNALGLLIASQRVIPGMKARGGGNIVVIGATASLRGGANFAPFASAKAAQRSLAQSMARHLGRDGVHVAYVVIDGVIGEAQSARENMANSPQDTFLSASDIADAVFFLTQQPRSAWTFEMDLRPFGESW